MAGYKPSAIPSAPSPLVAVPSVTSGASIPSISSSYRPSSTPSSGASGRGSYKPDELLWLLDVDGVDRWIRSIHALIPKRPRPRVDKSGNVIPGGPGDKKTPTNVPQTAESLKAAAAHGLEQLQLQKKEESEYIRNVALANRMHGNLLASLRSASVHVEATDDAGGANKRIKTESGAVPTTSSSGGVGVNRDLYSILDPSFTRGKDVVHVPGAILSRLTLGGMTNALAGKVGGVVDNITGKPLQPPPTHPALAAAAVTSTPPPVGMTLSTPIPTASNMTVSELISKSRILHRAVSARLEIDMLNSTPRRIVEMLCPDVSSHEIDSIKKRIYDTVVLGRGTNSSQTAAALEGTEDLPVSARGGSVHDVEKFQKCKVCGNADQSAFVLDRKNGDLICSNCGTVATESLMHEGSQFRKFEGEADRNHHGDVANPLYSNAHNMGTTLGGMSVQTGAGIGGFGSSAGGGGKRSLENILRNAHAYTEMNISQFGKEEKKTRVGYKDKQKKDAFVQMGHVGNALNLHEAVVQRAKELFAGFRDDRELVQQFKGVVAACLCEAFDQLSRDGRQLLRKRAGEDDDEEDGNKITNARANRRNELHSANLAGKGGIVLNKHPTGPGSDAKSNGGKDGTDAGGGGDGAVGALESKSAGTWDLDDCRSWLLEASRSIARQWTELRNDDGTTAKKTTAQHTTPRDQIPKGTLDELEGKLVEHTLTLCDYLEKQLKQRSTGSSRGRAVVTPRVKTMGKLGIKWQHSHERGSGGKGGVGNSGRTTIGTKPGERTDGRSAGQILLLLTSKKLGSVLKDPVSGDAFHRELRALRVRQEAMKKKEMRDEAARQRFKQMERKPWLQAKAQL